MALHDARLILSSAQAVTASANSTNVVDLGPVPNSHSLGHGDAFLVVSIDAPFTDGGSAAAEVTCSLVTADTTNLVTGQVEHAKCFQVTAEGGTRGVQYVAPLPSLANARRYLGLVFGVTSGPCDGGTVSAYITTDAPVRREYPSAIR